MRELVFVFELSVPMTFYWNRNPLISEIIFPLKGNDAEKLEKNCKDFIFLELPIYGSLVWWTFRKIEIWEKGKLIFERSPEKEEPEDLERFCYGSE